MTVKELIETLRTHPEDMEVVLPVNYGDEYGAPEPFVQPAFEGKPAYLVLGG